MPHRPLTQAFWLAPGCLALSLLCALLPLPLQAQIPDSIPAQQDTLSEPEDSVLPPPRFVELGSPRVQRQQAGIWFWDTNALALAGAVNLLDLLQEIPGVVTLRSGMFLQPEVASAFGGTSPRVEVDLDGFVLDPLAASALDLATIELSHLSEVLVERRIDLLRIRLRSAAATEARAYSRVEAGIGQPDANLFRGVFLAPNVLLGPFGLAVERFDTDGVGRTEPADVFAGWLKWGWLTETRGIQLEVRQSNLDREPRSPWPESRKRRDLMLRLRNRFAPGVALEAFIGRSRLEVEQQFVEQPPDSLLPSLLERSSYQGGVRAAATYSNAWLEAGIRGREHEALPRVQTDISAGVVLPNVVTVRGDVTHATWRAADATTALSVRADAGPLVGLSPFVEWSAGKRGAPLYDDTLRTGPLIEDRSGYRLGGEATARGVRLGGALVHVETDSVPAFRLPFDTATHFFPGGALTGWELYGRVPLYVRWLVVDGSYLRWTRGTRWAYVPADTWRAALELHVIPLASGNLEILGRLEGLHRGEQIVPDPEGTEPAAVTSLPARNLLHSYLQIRILDVRIFGRLEDMIGNSMEDIPGQPVRGPRLLWGVKWQFWN